MSWQATAWAKRTQGHETSAEKLLLLILADCADPESALAFPGMKALVTYMETGERTVRRSLRRLEAAGFISEVRHGNQYLGASVYLMNLDVTVNRLRALAPANMAGAQTPKQMSTGQSVQSSGQSVQVHRPSVTEHRPSAVSAPDKSESKLSDWEKEEFSNDHSSDPDRGDGHGAAAEAQKAQEAQDLWRAALAILESQVTRPNFETWFRDTSALGLSGDNVLQISAPSRTAREWLRTRAVPLCNRAAAKAADRPINVEFV